MKLLIVFFMFSASNGHAMNCIPEGTSFVDTIMSKDFAIKNADALVKVLTPQIEKMAKFRRTNCNASPEVIFDNCRSVCKSGRYTYSSYKDTCLNYCAIQKLKVQLAQCEVKLKAIVQIEKDIRSREKENNSRANQ